MPHPTPLEVVAETPSLEAPHALGRVIESDALNLAIMALYHAGATDIPARPVVPALHSFHVGFVQNLRRYNRSARYFGAEPSDVVPHSVKNSHDLLATLYHSKDVDTVTLASPLTVAVKGVQARPHKSKDGTYVIRLFVGDHDNYFYKDGYSLYGENLTFLGMRDPSTPMPDLIDEQKKRHRIVICELATDDDSRAKRLAKGIRELLGPKILIGAFGHIPTPAEYFDCPDLEASVSILATES